ncbi:MAG: S1 RNA-binding domain-containing protein, partial [Acidimicrobiia bacterium]|nr:S1 RNA-binding domain-containing protein [Acidimicrobiia bacterium]
MTAPAEADAKAKVDVEPEADTAAAEETTADAAAENGAVAEPEAAAEPQDETTDATDEAVAPEAATEEAATDEAAPTDEAPAEDAASEDAESDLDPLVPVAAEDVPLSDDPADKLVAQSPAEAIKEIGELPSDLSEEDFAAAVEKTVVEFSEGSLVTGTVVRIDHDEVLVDIGYKSEGVIPANELSIRNNVDPGEIVSLGDEVETLVLQMEDQDGRLILSKKRAQYERAWGRIEKVMEEGGTVTGTVIEVVKGGLIVDIGLRGFLPASLVELRRVRDLHPYVGNPLEAKVIELDKNRNNVVLSRRAYLEEEQAEQRQAFLDDLKPGEVREGTVSSVVNFGAFVDLGGMDGLVHVSELSWQHVSHPSEIVSVGDKVQVRVLEVDL